ncbi:MAG: hypothetical protein ACOX7D_01420 [Alphaproteobacteria bacterium]|jgi:hypothetical protein
MSNIKNNIQICGYHGCNVIPDNNGCECTKCNPCTNSCKSCDEPQKRADEQLLLGIYDFEILKCKECMLRFSNAYKSK